MPKFSVKKPFTIVVGVIMLLVLGAVSFTRMTTDLLPTMNIPYLVVITTYPGASPEKVESSVTQELEAQLGTVNGVENVTSTSAENYSMVMLEFDEETDMDSAMVKVTTQLDQLDLPENTGKPMVMEMSMDMVATMEVSVDYEGKDIYELTDFVNETVVPYLERQSGVASVNPTGLVEKSIEVRLNQEKIDDVNDRLLTKVDKELAKAKKKITKAENKIKKGKKELEDGKKELEDQQTQKSDELAQFSQLLDQAMANEAAYNAQLVSLKASRTALKTELKAYKDNGVVSGYNQLNKAFASMREALQGEETYQQIYQAVYDQALLAAVQAGVDSAGIQMEVTQKNVDSVLEMLGEAADSVKEAVAEQSETIAKEQVETQLASIPEDIKDALDNPEKLKAVKKLMKQQGQAKMAKSLTASSLQTMYDIVNTRIPQIETELANLKIEIATAKAVVDQMEESIAEAKENYTQVESGKITAAAAFGAANAQMSSGESALEEGEEQLKEAKKSYKESRKQALENANLDSLLTMSTISGILTAENFDMPAGYINEGENQYLLKVGNAYESLKELKNSLLCKVDGIGDVRLKDVADITMIDNSGETYAKVNGNDAILLAISKTSTAGTSDVSKRCNKALAELEEKYEGLSFTSFMDQGDYIKLIINSVLSNLIYGALLAVLVLALFLKDVRPTVIVAFSIPLSVLFAIVLMYFTNITLNVISLSGLALGVGMLVDNSIVVVENIYRLRSKGVPAARAAVVGANQVAGAITASTITTICVFLPIVFTDGLTRQLMMDMCLTIAYSLIASLIVALTFVPCMGATVLKDSKEKEHRWFDAVVNAYEKILRFCLRFKIVPLSIAVLLLVFCVWRVFLMGMELIPDMGGNQMSVSVTAPDDTTQDEDYEMADQILDKIMKTDGVESVGGMTSNSMAMLTGMSTGESKDYSFYIVLNDKAANDNEKVKASLESDLQEYIDKGCEISVSTSNMDLSSLGSSGLQVDIRGKDLDTLLSISEDIEELVGSVDGFENISNGQEEGDRVIKVIVNKDKAMRYGLTVAQIYAELSAGITTDTDSTTLTIDNQDYAVTIVDDREELTADKLLSHKFETTTTDSTGQTTTETHKLKEFAEIEDSQSVASISRDNQERYLSVTADTKDGYNTTLLSRKVQKLLDEYDAPEGYTLEISGESTTVNESMKDMLLMIVLAVVFIYLVMVAQFQSILSPFIVLFTIPLAFTGGFLALLVSGEILSIISMMGFLVLAGVVVNNGIVFVDYANQLRLEGMEKREALVETGKTRMRPILMTALTTILAMATMAFSQDASASMGKGMAIVTIGGLAYATLMTLFIVPVLYDLMFRRELKKVDLGDEENLLED
jgi:HAE1 family hydrophobic/amphiphilic exporter-1